MSERERKQHPHVECHEKQHAEVVRPRPQRHPDHEKYDKIFVSIYGCSLANSVVNGFCLSRRMGAHPEAAMSVPRPSVASGVSAAASFPVLHTLT